MRWRTFKHCKENKSKCKYLCRVGDFNNVAWANSSILFRKMNDEIDVKIRSGFISAFHTKYWFLKFPIDLMLYTPAVLLEELRSLEYFGSDHFTISVKFFINRNTAKQEHLVNELEHEKHDGG